MKVVRGAYDPIPSTYSKDLSKMIKGCLQVKPANRFTSSKILATPDIMSHIVDCSEDDNEEQE